MAKCSMIHMRQLELKDKLLLHLQAQTLRFTTLAHQVVLGVLGETDFLTLEEALVQITAH